MSGNDQQRESDQTVAAHAPRRRRRIGAVQAIIALTLVACAAAILFRDAARARYWAWRLARSDSPAEQSVFLAAMCNSGAQARWAVGALLADARPEIRQFGVLVLQNVPADWARQRLFDRLRDDDPAVRRLAAVGLALRHEPAVTPQLAGLYATGDAAAAQAACVALARLGDQGSLECLDRLARQPAAPEKRAALIAALECIGTRACGPPLLQLLSDDRPCAAPPPAELALAGLPAEIRSWVHSRETTPVLAGPASGPTPATVAERAAAALGRISGITVAPLPTDPRARADAVARWTAWANEATSAPR